MIVWQLSGFVASKTEVGRARFFLNSYGVDYPNQELEFDATYTEPPGITALGLGRDQLPDGYIQIKNLFLYVEAALRGFLDPDLLPTRLTDLPLPLTAFLVSNEKHGKQKDGLLQLLEGMKTGEASFQTEATLLCVAELHSAIRNTRATTDLENTTSFGVVDDSLHREVADLPADRLLEAWNHVRTNSSFQRYAEEDPLVDRWESHMNDLMARLTGVQ